MEKAPDEEMGFCIYDRFQYLTKARCYLLEGRNEQAYNLLIKCDYYAKIMKRPYLEMEGQLLGCDRRVSYGKKRLGSSSEESSDGDRALWLLPGS